MTDSHKKAIRFIIFFGVVSLFADVTYEGTRSITGPFLDLLRQHRVECRALLKQDVTTA